MVGVTWRGWIPRLRVAEKSAEEDGGYTRSRTKEYDQIAVTTMLHVLLPLVAGYSVYSLAYHQHRSWLSWLLSSLTGSMYAFGFVNMTPQLFINYKHKSVAAMPWRAMSYKVRQQALPQLFVSRVKQSQPAAAGSSPSSQAALLCHYLPSLLMPLLPLRYYCSSYLPSLTTSSPSL